MKTMRYTLVFLLALLLVSAAACGAQNAAKPSQPPTPPVASAMPAPSAVPNPTASPEPSAGPASGEEQTFEGTVDEVKNFMLTITNGEDEAYVFGTDSLDPSALEGVASGDKVSVTYTGTLADMDGSLEITGLKKVP